MKNQITKQISRLALAVFAALSMASVAQGSECAMSADALRDTQALASKMMAHLEGSAPSDIVSIGQNPAKKEAIMDNKFHKIDRSKKGFKQFDAVGIVTANAFENQFQSYGSGVLISPCHVLTNRHVVQGLAESKGQRLTVGSPMYFSVGQAKSCDSINDFEEQSLKGKVVDFGGDEIVGHQDWAIVKLERPVNSEIRPAMVNINPLVVDQYALRVGFPGEGLKDSGFKNSRAQYVVGKSVKNNGLVKISDTKSRPGLSGAGIFVLDPGDPQQLKSVLAGINVGEDNTLSVLEIFKQIAQNNRGTVADMKRAIQTGSCQ